MITRIRASKFGIVVTCINVCAATSALASAAGPTVGNPNANEAAEDPIPKQTQSARKVGVATGVDSARFYGSAEGRHVMNDYYSETGERIRRDPAFHGRLQLGARFYGDRLDVSGAVGAVKMPASQAIYQKRPELLVDIYPIKGQYFNLMWYNMLQFPVRDSDRDPTEFADSDLYEQDARRGLDATVFTTGLAPVLKTEWRMFGGKYLVRAGADGWTKMYSKPLYVDESNSPGGEGVGLVSEAEEPADKPFEDRAMRYVHQESLAVGWTPSFLSSLSVDVGAHIESRYIPEYFRDEVGGWDYRYKPERVSFWRTRLALDLGQSVSLHNELYTFRNGFFAENRVNDERRFRNVVRLAVKL